MPKNSILLIGNESRGKTKAITDICAVLKQKRLLRYAEVPIVGFERYPTNSEDDLFLSDIYKALYSQSDVVVFENIDKANFRCLDIVFQLIKTGTYRLHKRYMLQNSVLVESTGMLNTASISELNANGKYGVLLRNLSAKAKRQLQLALLIDQSCKEQLIRCYDTTKGVNGLIKVIDEYIYKPLSEYRLNRNDIRVERQNTKYGKVPTYSLIPEEAKPNIQL